MKPYTRRCPDFSLCGLPCGLCPRHHTTGSSRCPGCGGEDFHLKHPACAVITCSRKHGEPEYCFECEAYPCERYLDMPEMDSFVSYVHVREGLDRGRAGDLDGLLRELARKKGILEGLLARWDDGKSKGFFCLAAQLLPLEALEDVMGRLDQREGRSDERADPRELLGEEARKRGIPLVLRK